MKITPYTTDAVQNSGAAQNSGSQEKAVAGNSGSPDRVQLSQDYQDLANAQKAIGNTSEVRTEKVAQIKNQLESGNYQVRPGEIAGKMLDEVI
jgi:negative regulator of flagellin synthesis FlgM